LSLRYRNNRAKNISELKLNRNKNGPKTSKRGWKTSEEIDRDSYEKQLIEDWNISHPECVLEKFLYNKMKERSEEYYQVSDTKPVFAYTIDKPKVIDISEVNRKEVYDRHRLHKKPCCQSQLDMIELSLLPDDSS
jgi:glutamyl/glutaminyl-tRNA synthetase